MLYFLLYMVYVDFIIHNSTKYNGKIRFPIELTGKTSRYFVMKLYEEFKSDNEGRIMIRQRSTLSPRRLRVTDVNVNSVLFQIWIILKDSWIFIDVITSKYSFKPRIIFA